MTEAMPNTVLTVSAVITLAGFPAPETWPFFSITMCSA